MSRIGKKPIVIPDKVQVSVQGKEVKVKGPLNSMAYQLPENISLSVKDNQIIVETAGGDPKAAGMNHGTTRTRLYNIVFGVSTGFSKVLELQGLGYRAQVQGSKLNLELGFSHPILFASRRPWGWRDARSP